MSQENVEIVRQSWEAFNRGDLDAFLADVADEAEFEETRVPRSRALPGS
jgi:ketosteroid isomerase-like protein